MAQYDLIGVLAPRTILIDIQDYSDSSTNPRSIFYLEEIVSKRMQHYRSGGAVLFLKNLPYDNTSNTDNQVLIAEQFIW